MQKGKKIVIIGGVAGGASAAARARRLDENAEIILLERGPYVSFANCGLPYHVGGIIKDRERLLVQTPKSLHNRFNIDVRVNTEALSIDREKREVSIIDHSNNREYKETYDNLVLSPGAHPIKLPLPGIESERVFTLRTIPDMDAIEQFIEQKQCKSAVVVGGGYIGLEMIEALSERGLNVTVVELANQLMGPIDSEMAAMLHQELQLHGVQLLLEHSVKSFGSSDSGLSVTLDDGTSIECDFAVFAIGVKPEIKLAQDAGLTIGKLGGIAVDKHMHTSDHKIFAVGDVIEIQEFISGRSALIPLAGPANRQGRIAADNIFGRESSYNNTQGTAVCKVFNLTVGMTGLNEKLLNKFQIPYEKIYIHAANHANYYPGATPINLKLLFDKSSGKILGAQAVGLNGIDKRIDVIATAMRCNATVFDLQEAELCYAPPYGSAKDVINFAGFAASNVIQGDTQICHTSDVVARDQNTLLVDVRTEEEVSAGTIPGAIHIPVDDLRQRLNELPKNKKIIVFCKVGLRGYIAQRILQQNGYDSRNLTGGYTTYMLATHKVNATAEKKTEKLELAPSAANLEGISSVMQIDACGLACPGPIQKLRQAIDKLAPGALLEIMTTDPGFLNDAPAWCHATGNEIVEAKSTDNGYLTIIRKGGNGQQMQPNLTSTAKKLTLVIFSNDLDKALAAFIIANGAASMGFEVTMFFTFWGLNVLRTSHKVKTEKNLIEKMFGFMMPRGANKLALSKMHMLGMGTSMIKSIMRKKQVSSLPELITSALESKVKLVACNMTMDLMGIKFEELISGVERGGVALYLDKAGEGNVNLFI